MKPPFTAAAASDVVDEALEQLHATDDEFGGGLSNHGPMAVEALASLGAVDVIPAWVRGYVRSLSPDERPPLPPVAGDWREAVRAEVPRLLPGAGSAAGHGCIRTAHAVALLEAADTQPRRVELARALDYWRRTFVAAPACAGRLDGTLDEALASLAAMPVRARGGLISDQLAALDPLPAHEADPDALIEGAARVLLAAHPRATLALVHAVTTPVALQRLSPYVEPGVATAHAWPVVAGLVASYADPGDVRASGADDDWEAEPAEAIAAAIESGDEHAIKLAAACAGRGPVHAAAVAATAVRLR